MQISTRGVNDVRALLSLFRVGKCTGPTHQHCVQVCVWSEIKCKIPGNVSKREAAL